MLLMITYCHNELRSLKIILRVQCTMNIKFHNYKTHQFVYGLSHKVIIKDISFYITNVSNIWLPSFK